MDPELFSGGGGDFNIFKLLRFLFLFSHPKMRQKCYSYQFFFVEEPLLLESTIGKEVFIFDSYFQYSFELFEYVSIELTSL